MVKNKKTPTSNVKQLQKQVTDLENHFKRALADYQNLEKRFSAQKLSLIKHANESLLNKLLPLFDDLERAQNHLQDSGLNMTIGQFTKVLSSEGVTLINTKNQPFNPETMDCAEVIPGKKDRVVTTLTKGYLYHDQVLRPARVKVGSGNMKDSSGPTKDNAR